MREEQSVAVERADLVEHAVRSLTDLVDRLPLGDSVAPERPAWALLADLGGRASLVGAVVPLHQLVTRLRPVAEAGEAAALERACERARQDDCERAVPKRDADRLGLATALLGQRDVGAPCVPAGARPVRLPVTNEDDLLRGMRRAAQPGGG